MLTLENYIMESEINDATVGDIYVEQALAELNVAHALCASYVKDSMYVEYMTEMGETDFYQEGDLGDKIANGWDKFIGFIKSIGHAIATAVTNFWSWLTEASLSRCIKKLKGLPEMNWEINTSIFADHKRIMLLTQEFCNITYDMVNSNSMDNDRLREFEQKIFSTSDRSDFIGDVTDHYGEKVTVPTSKLVSELERLNSADVKGVTKKAIHAAKAVIKECDKALKAENKESRSEIRDIDSKEERKTRTKERKETYKSGKEYNKNSLDLLKKCSKELVNLWRMIVRNSRSVANKILKFEKTEDKRVRTNAKYEQKMNKNNEKAARNQEKQLGVPKDQRTEKSDYDDLDPLGLGL